MLFICVACCKVLCYVLFWFRVWLGWLICGLRELSFGFRVVVMMRCGLFGVLLLVVLRLRVCGVWLG